MITGHMLFYIGLVLFVATILLAALFWIKKTQYVPDSAIYDGGVDQYTQKLRSGYPTDRLTIRRELRRDTASSTEVLPAETMLLEESQTEVISQTDVLKETEVLTELLDE